MISSLLWLLLIKLGLIDSLHAPWKFYIPVLIVEIILTIIIAPKVFDKIDKWRAKND